MLAFIYVTTCVTVSLRGQTSVSETLGLELQTIVGHRVVLETKPRTLQEQQMLLIVSRLPSPGPEQQVF